MELKTKVKAEEGRQDLFITREFDLPLELLFRAYTEPELLEQWMGTMVLKLENKKYGGYHFETKDQNGNVVLVINGAIHEFTPNEKITRTFEMMNAPYGATLEFLEFEKLTEDTSRLNMHVVYRSNALRDENLKLPFKQGVNWAHNELEKIVSKLK
ncbi:SRPBCC domain-containing protein [Chitinophaga sp. YIM B06452]|uniref:SRPBCC domain-containing protein n=1 Tax=Chitinophaga sp. YIM B06452 TaxID=3082158 RepID=UPI0031FEC78B